MMKQTLMDSGQSGRVLSSLLCAASLAISQAASAGTFNLDFNTDPFGVIDFYGSAAWRSTGGVDDSGFLSVTDAVGSQMGVIIFPDLDEGLVVKAFEFSVDVRVGGGTESPADGFSINYAREGDPVLESAAFGTPSGFSSSPGGEENLPEEGTVTGLAIGFDSWDSGSGDVIGISVKVDDVQLAQFPFPVLNGALDDPQSLQTGPRNPDFDPAFSPIEESWALLGWARLEVELREDGRLFISYKGNEVTPEGGLATTFFPSPGRLIFAGRTGGSNQNHHIDNVSITTIPAEQPFLTGLTGTATGFILEISDGATQLDPDSLEVLLNDEPVTVTVTKDGNTSTGVYQAPTPLPSESENTVVVTFSDTAGNTSTSTREFTVRAYQVIVAEDAVPADTINTGLPGFTADVYQIPIARFPGDGNSLNNAERQIARRYIDPATGQPYANIADLTEAQDGLFIIEDTINWNQDVSPFIGGGEIGSFTSASDPSRPDVPIPGIPNPSILNPDLSYNTDWITAEVLTYLELEAGLYTFVVNSDDGFRVTAGHFNRDRFTPSLGEWDGGKGSSDVLFDVYVEETGIYPIRLAWWEGTGGANLEFFVIDEQGNRTLINDRAIPGHIPAYRSSSAPVPPFVTFVSPSIGQTLVTPDSPVVLDIHDGSEELDASSVSVEINGTQSTVTASKNGSVTTLTAHPTSLPAPGSVCTVQVTYGIGNGEVTTRTWEYTVANYFTLSTALASPIGSGNDSEPGFRARIYQIESELGPDGGTQTIPTVLEFAESILAGVAGPNLANMFDAEDGVFSITDVINFEQTGVENGAFPAGTTFIPGIPGSAVLGPDDNITGEFITYIEFPEAGAYEMGVSSDDGFRVTPTDVPPEQVFQVLSPAAIAGAHPAVPSDRSQAGTFGVLPTTPIIADVVYANPGEACDDLTNAEELAGKIALVDRGTCPFFDKALRAQEAGAVAVIIANNGVGFPIIAAGGTEAVTIPVIMVSLAVGDALKANLDGLRVRIGADPTPILGQFNGGRGVAGNIFDGTRFVVYAPQAGVYPFRLFWFESGGGAGVEWYHITPDLEGILINDRSNPQALRAYRSRTFTPSVDLVLSASLVDNNLVLTWTGGTGPYVVESQTVLGGSWSPVLTTNEQQASIPIDEDYLILRVRIDE